VEEEVGEEGLEVERRKEPVGLREGGVLGEQRSAGLICSDGTCHVARYRVAD
jgi:hypothetical protein